MNNLKKKKEKDYGIWLANFYQITGINSLPSQFFSYSCYMKDLGTFFYSHILLFYVTATFQLCFLRISVPYFF